jgi:hypothetical protein
MGPITVESNEAIQIMAKILNTGNATVNNLMAIKTLSLPNLTITDSANTKKYTISADTNSQGLLEFAGSGDSTIKIGNGGDIYGAYMYMNDAVIQNTMTTSNIKASRLKLNNNSSDDKDSTYFFDDNGNNEIKRPTNFSDPVNMFKGAGVYGGLYCNGDKGIQVGDWNIYQNAAGALLFKNTRIKNGPDFAASIKINPPGDDSGTILFGGQSNSNGNFMIGQWSPYWTRDTGWTTGGGHSVSQMQ